MKSFSVKKTSLAALLLCSLSAPTLAADSQCLSGKYDAYIDASLTWYRDLIQLTADQYPNLTEVSQWFYKGREQHFELNRAAVHHFLKQDTSKVATELPVESWLKLEQKDVKELASRSDQLGRIAAESFSFRQSKPHAQNYELRSAFADLLSHPNKIDSVLTRYNDAISKAEAISCN